MKRFTFLLVPFFILLSLLASPLSTSYASSSFASTDQGNAFGDYAIIVSGQNRSTAGPTAPVGLSCNHGPTTLTNSASISLSQFSVSGSAQTMITTSRTATSASIQASSDIQNLTLLSGLIQASSIHVAVSSTATTTGATSANNSTFSGLTVAGLPANPAPNTLVNLPGVGYVILNEQTGPVNGPSATSISVNGIDVYITIGPLAGSRIILGHADSAETRTLLPAVVRAFAYGLYATGLAGPGSTSIGPIAPVGINCTGGSAQNSASGFSSPIIGSTGAVSTDAFGQITSSDAQAIGEATVSNMNLLTSLISANKVTVVATANWNGSGSRSGSMTLTNGKVNGVTLSPSPRPNTQINLPGIGYVIVNEQYGSNNAKGATENVIAFDIHVTQSNNLGLPKGSEIIMGFATASANIY